MFSQEAVNSGKYNYILKYKAWDSRFIAEIGDIVFSRIHPEYPEYGGYSILEYADIVILWIPCWSMLTLWIAECLV